MAKDRPVTGADIERLRNEERQRIMLKQFFPRGLASRFEKETQILINEMVTGWLGRRFHAMITSMRKVLENEIITTLPFLRFTIQKEKGDPRLVLTKIADAVINDTKEVNKSIDLMVDLMQFTERKHYKKWLKGKLPSFLKEVVYVRNFFEKEDGPGVSKQKKRDMEAKSDELYRRFFGIGCEGVFPVLMELKARSRRE